LRKDSDEQLIRRFQGGDTEAFERFVERHQDRVYRLACAWLYSPQNAPDAAQDVFLRAFTGLPRFRFRATPFTWLYRTLRNVCQEYNRRDASPALPLEERDLVGSEDASHESDRERRLAELLQRVRRLPERQRDVVMLRLFEGMSIADTARTLGCRPGTVKAQLNRAVKKLKDTDAGDASAAGKSRNQ
jgi:RNA polymerase sigma-70 factor (ECF subfamily)